MALIFYKTLNVKHSLPNSAVWSRKVVKMRVFLVLPVVDFSFPFLLLFSLLLLLKIRFSRASA